MRVAFFGTPQYAVPTLDALIDAGHEVVTVVAQPDKRRGRGKKLQSPPVVQRARELGLEPDELKTLFRAYVAQTPNDLNSWRDALHTNTDKNAA